MDYITRRSNAQLTGTVRFWLGPDHHPHLAALGVRISFANGEWEVNRTEFETLANDLGLEVALPPGAAIDADALEEKLRGIGTPTQLRAKARSFLRSLYQE